MLLLEQDITKKWHVNKKTPLKPGIKFEIRDNNKYEVEIIINSAVYGKEVVNNQMPDFYYLIL